MVITQKDLTKETNLAKLIGDELCDQITNLDISRCNNPSFIGEDFCLSYHKCFHCGDVRAIEGDLEKFNYKKNNEGFFDMLCFSCDTELYTK